jgi:hypothetical protein
MKTRSTRRDASLIARLFASLMVLLQAACSGGSAVNATPDAARLPTGTVVHGPFEIVAGVRSISAGGFPNTSGNPFTRRDVSEFQLRWRGKAVAAPGGNQRFWRVLRLQGAPRPAVLLVTHVMVLATEDAAGQLQLTPINAESSSLAAVQWLDSANGQPGPSVSFGIEAITDLQAGTSLEGGRWLRLGSRSVLDLSTLAVANVDPWVPMVPGVPVTSISRQGDHVRAFSPGRTQYVLAAAGADYSRADGGQAYGLLVVDIKSGIAKELRMDRRRFRFAEVADLDAAWIDHHFMWQLDPAGRERLVPRQRFTTWPWRAKLESEGAGRWALRIQRIDAAFVPVLRRLLQRELGLQMAGPSAQPDISLDFALGGCTLQAMAFGVGSSTASNHYVSIWPATETPAGSAVGCEPALRRLAALIDAELATGRHDALLKFD